MTNTLRVFLYELSRNFRRRGYLFTTFGLPVLLIALVYGAQLIGNSGTRQTPETMVSTLNFDFRGIQRAGFVDESGLFTDTASTTRMRQFASRDEARAALEAGEIDALYLLPADYVEGGDVQLVIPGLDLNRVTSAPVRQLVFERFADQANPTLLERLRTPSVVNLVDLTRASEVDDGAVRNEDTSFALVYGFAILFMLTVFGTSGYLMQSVIEEKESKLVEVLISSVRPTQLLSGKILAMGVLGFFQITVWIAIGVGWIALQGDQFAIIAPFLAAVRIPLDALPLVAVYFLLGYLLFAAVFGAIGALSNSLQEGPQLSTVFVLPALAPLFALTLFISDPNSTIPFILSIFPVTAPMAMTMRVVATAVPLWQVAISLLLLGLTVWGAFWMAGRLFRVQTLLAGQTPKVREIPGLIFGKS